MRDKPALSERAKAIRNEIIQFENACEQEVAVLQEKLTALLVDWENETGLAVREIRTERRSEEVTPGSMRGVAISLVPFPFQQAD